MQISKRIKQVLGTAMLCAATGAVHAQSVDQTLIQQATPYPKAVVLDVVTNPDGTIRNQYIVTLLKPGLSSPVQNLGLADLVKSLLSTIGGGKVLHLYESALFGFAAQLTPAQAQQLKSLPLVLEVSPDRLMKVGSTQRDPANYGLDRIDQRDLPLNARYNYPDQAGEGVHLYIIDSGINSKHEEFAGHIGGGLSFLTGTAAGDWGDCHGHGTHVAGTAAGTKYGVAKKATLHSLRVADCNGSASSSDILAALNWLAGSPNAPRPAVANMSIGTVGGRSTQQETAARAVVNANVAFAVSAGNEAIPACERSPAAEPAVLTVGATDKSDASGYYSNYGACVDLFAPGTDIFSAYHADNTSGVYMTGTSMASPHVAGALAIKRGTNPNLNAVALQNALVAETTSGKLTNLGTGSPNKLLYVYNTGEDFAPVAAFTYSCDSLACSFDASTSTDDRGIKSYAWQFGDGGTAAGVKASRAYAKTGVYTVTLTVTDTAGTPQQSTLTKDVKAYVKPCTNCTVYKGTLAANATAYQNSATGFTFEGGTLNGYLRGPAGANFDLVLEKAGKVLVVPVWSVVATSAGTSSDEDLSYVAAAGTYRWRVQAKSGSGDYTLFSQPR